MDRRWIPTVAGVLDILAAMPGLLVFCGLVFAQSVIGHALMDEDDFPFDALQGLLVVLGLGFLVLAVLAIIGGGFALARRKYGWMIVGSIAAAVCFPPLGIPAVILTILAEKEMGGPQAEPAAYSGPESG